MQGTQQAGSYRRAAGRHVHEGEQSYICLHVRQLLTSVNPTMQQHTYYSQRATAHHQHACTHV